MNEYEYAFTQDVRNKKLIATGARHRATRGTKSFAVHNQSDYLTKKELKAMSGEVHEFNLNKPMKWNQYQLLDVASKRLYLETLVNKYNAKAGHFAKMFGMSYRTAFNELSKFGLTGKNGCHQSPRERAVWESFVNGDIPAEENALDVAQNLVDEMKTTQEPEPCLQPDQKLDGIWSAKMELIGSSKEKVIADLCAIVDRVGGYGKLYKITLEVE